MTDDVRMIDIKEDILADNNRVAQGVRRRLSETKTLLLNLMSSPGSGKTSLILRTMEGLKGAAKLGVDLWEHVGLVLTALQGIAAELELDGRLAAKEEMQH